MIVPCMPAYPRESMADGVSRSDAARSASAMPGSSVSQNARVTWGVRSRGEMPVPPGGEDEVGAVGRRGLEGGPDPLLFVGNDRPPDDDRGERLAEQPLDFGSREVLVLPAGCPVRDRDDSDFHG